MWDFDCFNWVLLILWSEAFLLKRKEKNLWSEALLADLLGDSVGIHFGRFRDGWINLQEVVQHAASVSGELEGSFGLQSGSCSGLVH